MLLVLGFAECSNASEPIFAPGTGRSLGTKELGGLQVGEEEERRRMSRKVACRPRPIEYHPREDGAAALKVVFHRLRSEDSSPRSSLCAYSLRMNVPLLPPLFFAKRISPIDISRSAALHIS